MARRGEQAVIEEVQCRRSILSPVSPQQRRMTIDELRLLDHFPEQHGIWDLCRPSLKA